MPGTYINYQHGYPRPQRSPRVPGKVRFLVPTISLSNSHESKKDKSGKSAIAQMSQGHQQVTGNINSFNNIVNFVTEIDDEGRQILQWLSPLEPQQRHQGVRTDRLDGVGNWVLETGEFGKWRDAQDGCVGPVLFCCGDPGVGKTYVR